MGLDMHLHSSSEDLTRMTSYDAIEAAVEGEVYWRKANAVHGWFVRVIQKGEDDCGMYEVTYSDLSDLRETCNDVLRDMTQAKNLLPPSAGFFYGSTEVDSDYVYDLEYTVEELDRIMESNNPDLRYFYSSSW